MKFDDNTYDILCYISRYILPALATFYFALASIWGMPYGEEIVGTLTALSALINGILGISSYNYNKDGGLDGK